MFEQQSPELSACAPVRAVVFEAVILHTVSVPPCCSDTPSQSRTGSEGSNEEAGISLGLA
jgi:hypothetical protein